MSAICFHSKSQGIAKLHGSERYHMMSMQREYGYKMNPTYNAVDPYSDVSLLNACMAIKSDPLKLMMRIHAQCESHCWVDGPNRAWIADIIDKGRQTGLYRAGMGWEEVQVFLRERNDEPVFLSYSVAEPFPGASCVGDMIIRREYEAHRDWKIKEISHTDTADIEAPFLVRGKWEDLTPEQQWSLHEQVLRLESKREQDDEDAPFSRELRPNNWNNYFFE